MNQIGNYHPVRYSVSSILFLIVVNVLYPFFNILFSLRYITDAIPSFRGKSSTISIIEDIANDELKIEGQGRRGRGTFNLMTTHLLGRLRDYCEQVLSQTVNFNLRKLHKDF